LTADDPGDAVPGGVAPGDGERHARWPLLFGVAAVVVALDQATKAWAVDRLDDGRVIELVGSLQLALTRNPGAAFSLGNGRGPLISLLALAVVGVLLVTGRKASHPGMAVALGLVVGGAFGNLIDRLLRPGDGFLGGEVIDFIDLQWWPVFNVADMAVVSGAVLLFLVQWREESAGSSGDAATGGDASTGGDAAAGGS
jgi:signal peptidase II